MPGHKIYQNIMPVCQYTNELPDWDQETYFRNWDWFGGEILNLVNVNVRPQMTADHRHSPPVTESQNSESQSTKRREPRTQTVRPETSQTSAASSQDSSAACPAPGRCRTLYRIDLEQSAIQCPSFKLKTPKQVNLWLRLVGHLVWPLGVWPKSRKQWLTCALSGWSH